MTLVLCGTVLSENIQLPIKNHRDALEIADQVSGFDKLPNFDDVVITVQKVVIEEDYSILFHKIENRPLWKVSYANVALEKDGERNPYIKAFDVFVDAETGQVVKISSQWLPSIDPIYQELAIRRIKHLKKVGTTRESTIMSLKIPEEFPKLSFFEAYMGTWVKRFGFDSEVKNIEGFYIYDRHIENDQEVFYPVWSITFRGGDPPAMPGMRPPITPSPDAKPEEEAPSIFSTPLPRSGYPNPESGDIGISQRVKISTETGKILSRAGNWRRR